MRILNIYFKNINSLGGEGRVNFDQGALAESGVFAITGPNGSGKTSILDVITLGLYGETYRFHKPAEHIITKHSDESLAQVEFAFDGDKYRSTWQVSRTDIDHPSMALTLLDGNGETALLAESPVLVRKRLQELTGLDFHKFSKSIVLPQGDFAAFLNALDSERMDILEKISGANIYQDYQAQIENQHAKLSRTVAELEQEVELIPLLTVEALEATEQDLHDFNELSSELNVELESLQEQLQNLQVIDDLQRRNVRLTEQQQLVQHQLDQLQADLQRIATAPNPEMFKDYLQLLKKMQEEVALSRSYIENYRRELSLLQQQLPANTGTAAPVSLDNAAERNFEQQKLVVDNLTLKLSEIKLELPRETELAQAIMYQLHEKQAMLSEVDAWLQEHQAEAVLVQDFPDVVQLRNVRNTCLELEGQQKTQAAWSKKTQAGIKKTKADLQAGQNRITELNQLITTNEASLMAITQGKTLAELQELLLDQQSRVKQFLELVDIAAVYVRLSDKKPGLSWFGGAKTETPADPGELQVRVDGLKLEIGREENIGKALELAIANETLLKKLNAYRDKLVDGKPCQLCGSVQHPYVLRPPAQTDSKKALTDQRSKILVLRTTLDSVQKQLAAAQKQNTNLTAKQKFLLDKRNEWVVLTNRLAIAFAGLEIHDVAAQKQLLGGEIVEQDKIKALVEEYTQLQRDNAKAKNEIAVKQAELGSLRLAAEQLEASWAERAPELAELEQRYQASVNQEKALIARLEPQLAKLGEKLPAKGKEDAVYDRLNSRRQDYQIRELRQNGLREELAVLQSKLQLCQAGIGKYQQQQAAVMDDLQREKSLGLHLAILEKQKLLLEQERQWQERQEALSSMELVIAGKISEYGLTDLAALHDLLALLEREPQLLHKQHELLAKSAQLDTDLAQLAAELQIRQEMLDATASSADLQAMHKLISEKVDIAKQEIRSLQNILTKQQQYRKKYAAIQTELDKQQQLWSASQLQLDELHAEPGNLRRKTQQLLIDQLLAHANRVLEKINGRYSIRGAISDHGLALEIEDAKQNKVRRLPKTLSGGESFVVSLALALALADVANQGKAIESLFLDEGFGNLDAESLYLALNTLEGLKLQGKTVGVISHVEGVKKRIKTQIELIKNANGLSIVKLVA